MLLNKLRNIVSDQLIYVISHSHFLYGILFWRYSTEFVFKRQKRAIKGMQGLNLKENGRTLQILTVPCIYTFICLVYVKENLDDLSLRKPIHTNSTRNTNNSVLYRLSKAHNSYLYLRIALFNLLPYGAYT